MQLTVVEDALQCDFNWATTLLQYEIDSQLYLVLRCKSKLPPLLPFQKNHEVLFAQLVRQIDESYLHTLQECVAQFQSNKQLANQSLLLYAINSQSLHFEHKHSYKLCEPSYGQPISSTTPGALICGLLVKNSHPLYQLSKAVSPDKLVTDIASHSLFGIRYQTNGLCFCLPIQVILQEPLFAKINPSVEPQLYPTCYLESYGSYCTGVLIQKNKIVSVRHILQQHHQQLGATVNVRRYPYRKVEMWTVTKLGTKSLDYLELTCKEKSSQSQFSNVQLGDSHSLGSQIMALSFGKFNYSTDKFNQFELLLPTISYGHISKEINICGSSMFIKTDAELSNGCSGSGIWGSSGQLLGLAVFIVKNSINNESYLKHNYSFSSDFLKTLRKNDDGKVGVGVEEDLHAFQKVNMRKKMLLRPKL